MRHWMAEKAFGDNRKVLEVSEFQDKEVPPKRTGQKTNHYNIHKLSFKRFSILNYVVEPFLRRKNNENQVQNNFEFKIHSQDVPPEKYEKGHLCRFVDSSLHRLLNGHWIASI